MIAAVIFDMDGLLVDSEPLWRKAEVKVFGELGVPMTEALCNEVMGLRIDEVVHYWRRRFPWDAAVSEAVVVDRIMDTMLALIAQEARPMKGVIEILNYFQSKNIRIALASSSSMVLIEAVLQKLGITNYFEVLRSAETEAYGKPHPAVYIETAKVLGVEPEDCLVFEDSGFGLIAAKAALMKAVAVPDPNYFGEAKFGIADACLHNLLEFDDVLFHKLSGETKD